jgi:hypothetical protein
MEESLAEWQKAVKYFVLQSKMPANHTFRGYRPRSEFHRMVKTSMNI